MRYLCKVFGQTYMISTWGGGSKNRMKVAGSLGLSEQNEDLGFRV